MRYQLKPILISCFVVFLCYIIFHPGRHAKYYSYIPNENILLEIIPNYKDSAASNLKHCDYTKIVSQAEEIYNTNDLILKDLTFIKEGGEYIPNECIPKYSTAVIVCYRNRAKQLELFLNYMHSYLSKQNIHYRIFIAEQNNTEPFNRALMLNHGSLVAMKYNFTCLILHDVDLLPLNYGNIYGCTNMPRHMSCCVNTMRYNLPYDEIVGGVVAIQSAHYQKTNGMSNVYFGWGAEDDDFYKRLIAMNLYPVRFSPIISKYMMMLHKHQTKSPNRYKLLADSLKRKDTDGLNTLSRKYEVKNMPLFTHVIVN